MCLAVCTTPSPWARLLQRLPRQPRVSRAAVRFWTSSIVLESWRVALCPPRRLKRSVLITPDPMQPNQLDTYRFSADWEGHVVAVAAENGTPSKNTSDHPPRTLR